MLLGLPKSPFEGRCIYGSDEKILLKAMDRISPKECHKQCIDNQGCVAFAYSFLQKVCNLYEGGPYIKGSGSRHPGHYCYIMKGKPIVVYYNI